MVKILAAIDGTKNSEKTLDFAVDIAKKTRSELILLNIIPKSIYPLIYTPFPFTPGYYPLVNNRKYQVEVQKNHEKILEEFLKKVKEKNGVNVSAILGKGRVKDEILEVIEKEEPELIIIGEKDVSGIKKFFFGSVSKDIIDHANRPVLVVK